MSTNATVPKTPPLTAGPCRLAVAIVGLIWALGSPAAAESEDVAGPVATPDERAADATQPAAPSAPLTIVSFDISQAPGLASETVAAPQKPSWRTTFGSEVRAETKSTLPALAIDADVVLLQGLTSMRVVRRLFPARTWKLVASRQLISSEDALDSSSSNPTAKVPTTAVAVRFQRDLRVTGQDHLMELAHRELTNKPKGSAGTAVRVSTRGKSMWFVSVGLTPDCVSDRVKCMSAGLLERWRRARLAEGEPTYVGGAISVENPAQPCSGQTIVGDDMDKEKTVVEPGTSERHAIAGCLARYEIAR